MRLERVFTRISKRTSHVTGHPITFFLALAVIFAWVVTGPIFNYSNTWQLAVNTGTTVVTFLMVFLIQHTQNRDTLAMQLKLDELIYATKKAHNALMNLEELSEDEMETIRKNYNLIASHARSKVGIKDLYHKRARHPHKRI